MTVMTKYEFVKQHEALLRECAIAGVSVQDFRNLPVFEDLKRLRDEGLKMEYCVDYVVQKYAISRSSAYRIAKDMFSKVYL